MHQIELKSQMYLIVSGNASLSLEDAGKHQDLLKIYKSVLEVYPDSAVIVHSLGDYLFR